MDYSPTLAARTVAFYETLTSVLRVRTVSDRTCFRRIAEWLEGQVRAGRFEEDVFEHALLYAREASLPGSKNPNAVFISICKKELGYDASQARS